MDGCGRWVAPLWALGWLLVVGCAEDDVGSAAAPVVYGVDDRLDVWEAPDGIHRAIAESAVAMQTDADFLDTTDPEDVQITYAGTLGESETLCADVRYQEQPDPGYCSGTLIDERHLLTAGHCVAEATDCSPQWPWVFGYLYEAADTFRTLRIDDIYECVDRVVFRNDTGGDYAIIELDRLVVGRAPVSVRHDASAAAVGTAITMVGHPNGIPMKIAGGATILDDDGQELWADVDAFFGNSGSGVFDDVGELVGLLVSGSPRDFRRRSGGGGCRELVVLASGEDYEYLTPVGVPLAELCAGGGPASLCDSSADGGVPLVDGGTRPEDMGSASPADGSVPRGDASGPTDMADDEGDDEGEGDGCDCRAGPRGGSAAWPLVLALGLVVRRRRGPAASS